MSWLADRVRRWIAPAPDLLGDEMRAHLELEIEDNVARGMDADAARDAARRTFGNATLVAERVREMRRTGYLTADISPDRYINPRYIGDQT